MNFFFFFFDRVDLLHYNLHKIVLNGGRSNMESPDCLKNKKTIINSINNDEKCFRCAVTVTLKYQNIEKDPQRISKVKPFIDQYNWKEMSFPSHQKNWKEFELNNKSIAFSILFVPYNTEEVKYAYKSKYSLKREIQAILLMITDDEK